MSSALTYTADALTPVKDRVLTKGMGFGSRTTASGIILTNDDTKSQGIRPRWAEVCAVGPDQTDVKVGQWVMVSHGRWTRGLKMEVAGEEMTVRMIDNADILLVSDKPQIDETQSVAVLANSDLNRIEGSLHNDGIQQDY